VLAKEAYEQANIGPEDIDMIELHDASSPSELMYYESLGLCHKGEGARFIQDGHSKLGGKTPVNPSGGLLRKGHPVGETGLAQITELADQLPGRGGKRQVEGARVALAENGGGYIGSGAAAIVITVLEK
jgi:acetyl-CoA acetyltransferase